MPTPKEATLRFIGFTAESNDEEAKLTIYPEYCKALEGLETFSHVIILYWLQENDTEEKRRILKVTPRRHPEAPELGVFACRSPVRPNPLAYEVCRLLKVEGCTLQVEGSDAYEGTPHRGHQTLHPPRRRRPRSHSPPMGHTRPQNLNRAP